MRYVPLLLLAGCSHAVVSPPAVEVRTVTRTVEVQRPCAATVPVRPKLARPLPDDAVKLSAVLSAAVLAWAGAGGYADRAEAAIRRCAGK